jgi:hypothetical protein
MREKSVGRAGRTAKATAGTEAIEVKVTVIERDEAPALRKFCLERENGQRRRIFFYDTRKLHLFKKGVCLRARATDGDECDSTVKIRPVEPKRVAGKWPRKSGFKVEADVVGSDVICKREESRQRIARIHGLRGGNKDSVASARIRAIRGLPPSF